MLFRTFAITFIAAASLFLGACSSTPLLSSKIAVRSDVSGNILETNFPTRVFAPSKVGVVDLYLTDIPRETLEAGGDISSISGTIVQVHVFLRPKAGRTPIDRDATTSIARVFILTGNGQAGLYAGGGFFLANDSGNGESYSGTMRGASLYLTRATAHFDDLLGPAKLLGSIGTTRDEKLAKRLAVLTQTIAENMDSVE